MLEAGERRGRLLWERRLLLALVDGVAVAAAFLIAFKPALGWSPLQEPALAVPMLLAAGRGWRVLGEAGHGDPARDPATDPE